MTYILPSGLFTHDDFTVRRYNREWLNAGDTVWVKITGRPTETRNGYWARVTEDFYPDQDSRITAQSIDSGQRLHILPDAVLYERVHGCECGAYGGDSWRICHPDA